MKNVLIVKKDLLYQMETKLVVDWMQLLMNTTMHVLNKYVVQAITIQKVYVVKRDIFGMKKRNYVIKF